MTIKLKGLLLAKKYKLSRRKAACSRSSQTTFWFSATLLM